MNRRKIVLAIAFVLGGLLVFRLYQQFGGNAANAGPKGPGGFGSRAQRVEATVSEFGTIRERVSLVGSLRAKHQVQVTPKVSGRLLEIAVDRGDAVRKGQVIARIEDDELQQQVHRARAALEVSRASAAQRQAELKSVEMEYSRSQSLEREGVISSEQREQVQTRVEVSKAQLNLAEAQVAQAEASLAELEIQLGQTEIKSPLTGVVGERHVDPGALVTSNTPVVLILDLTRLVTVVNVPERDITKIQVGNLAKVVVDAVPGKDLDGRVVRIAPILDPQTRTAPVEIEVPNPTQNLKAEMFARVDLNLTTERETLLIPRDALVYRGNRSGVFVVESDKVRFQVIETGIAEEDRIEVRAGLSEGTTVVTRGANLLKNGDSVQILQQEGETDS
jgi:RND family efflux transporter MFP subunit